MKENINIIDWQINFAKGEYDNYELRTQIKAGWYDWFCKNTSLVGKTKRLGSIIRQIRPGGKLDLRQNYVWFKNNCPLYGPLFDDFRFASLEDGEVQYTVRVASPWDTKRYAVYGRKTKGAAFSEEALFETGKAKELVTWFNTPWEA